MLTHRNVMVVFLLLLAIAVTVHVAYLPVPFWIYILLFLIYSFVVFRGCISIEAGYFIRSICSLNTTEKVIAISFDDGHSAEYTPTILSILKEQNIEATFFCIGNRIKGNENIVLQTINEGHIIGNHSYTHHFFFDMYSSKNMLLDLQKMDTELQQVTGLKPLLFRPPYGVTNPNLKRAIIKGNYTSIGWNVRSMDTVAKDKDLLFKKITGSLAPGAVYLFHDTCAITAEVLPSFIRFVKDEVYKIVRLDKLLNLKVYA